MDGYRISRAARETGFTVSALRFYEQVGIVVPDRSDNGYRTYDDRALGSLRFIARAKRLGLSLDETRGLLDLLDEEACEPVQARMSTLVGDRIDRAQEQVADLVQFTAELQRVAARLSAHTAAGPCDERCGCTRATRRPRRSVPLAGSDAPHIACSLEPADIDGRVGEWRAVLAGAERREAIDGGMRLTFAREADVVAISSVAAAEQVCCSFFTFAIGIDQDAITLDIIGPPEAQSIIGAFAGA